MKNGTGNIVMYFTPAQMQEALTEYVVAHFGELGEGRSVEQVAQESGTSNMGGCFRFVITEQKATPLKSVA